MSNEGFRLFWGDLHSHSAASYGYGTPLRALACAKQQLDFCSVTGHAFWPDMPTDRSKHARIIDYHTEGFARCAQNWPLLQQLARENESAGAFVPFVSYEWHSLEYGDYNIYYLDPEGPLLDGESPSRLQRKLEETGIPFIMIPHHIGYKAGYRGINWDAFSAERSPLVEVFSMHGCSESDLAPYHPMHTMGPRDYRSTAEYGYKLGHRFGLIGSTDHHGGFPGSYGDGRVGVWAKSLTRQGLWDAFVGRRTCAVTGDKISPLLRVDGAWPGEVVPGHGSHNHLDLDVVACDFIDYVEVLQNETIVQRIPGRFPGVGLRRESSNEQEVKIRIEWGWGPRDSSQDIQGELQVLEGALLGLEPCFRGQTVLSPEDEIAQTERIPHEILHVDAQSCSWRSTAAGNASARQAETQAIIATVSMPLAGIFQLKVNGLTVRASLADMITGSQSYMLDGWRSHALRLHRAVPKTHYTLRWSGDLPTDTNSNEYRVRVAQRNGQWAWSSPTWVVR